MNNNKSRLYTLDYLRGLAALGIMTYHCMSWAYGLFSNDSFMGKWGVYGVSIFYMLSGLTLYHVYWERMKPSFSDLTEFYFKRVFRIYPLLWLTILLTVLVHPENKPSLISLGLNLTGIFGLIKWDGYIGTGVWSIGNELVFYLFFPLFIFLAKKSKVAFYLFSAILFATFLYFAFYKLNPGQKLSVHDQWVIYINPLNQVFLFLSGFLIGYFLTDKKISSITSTVVFIVAFAAFIFYKPVEDNLSAGINRMILSLICFAICIAFYKNKLRFPAIIDSMLGGLGEASYSVYLLHPIVWFSIEKLLHIFSIELAPGLKVLLTIGVTLTIGYYNYKYFETLFVRTGRKWFEQLNLNKHGKTSLSQQPQNEMANIK
jgi:peptidoglycan/LPS O-acetylase OafA/YrhL